MITIQFNIKRDDVYREVARATAYTGAKMDDDNNAVSRIATVTEDDAMLERFWLESCSVVADALKGVIKEENNNDSGYSLALELSDAFDRTLVGGMQSGIRSFMVQNITALWFGYTNKAEAAACAEAARRSLDETRRKAYHKRRPTRPTY